MSLEDFKNDEDSSSDQPSKQEKSNRSRRGESKEHFNKKIQVAEDLEDKGWNVEVEKKVRTDNIADVYARKAGKELIVEIGSIRPKRLELLRDEFDEVRNVGYEYLGQEVKGNKSRTHACTKSVSLSDEAFVRLMRQKPEDMELSRFIERVAMNGLQKKQNRQITN